MPRSKNQYFRDKVRQYYGLNKRDFYWRRTRLSPFQVMITELFLKKTRAETVDKFMLDFVTRYDTSKKLLKASEKEILKQVSTLGLGNQRTRALVQISRHVHEYHAGELPCDLKEIMEIPHVGLYIANATMCFGFNKRYPILDVNTSRVISRFFSMENKKDLRDDRDLQAKAGELLPREGFKEYNWGLLDLSAGVCRSRPSCTQCPLRRKCDASGPGNQ